MVELTLIIAVISFMVLFPLFLLLISEYLEDYIAGSSINEDMEQDGGYMGMVEESMSQAMNEALMNALEQSNRSPVAGRSRIRKRRKGKKTPKKKSSKRPNRGKPSRFPSKAD